MTVPDDLSHHGPKARDRRKMAELERLARALCASQGWSWASPKESERTGNFSGDNYCDHIRAVLQALREPPEFVREVGGKRLSSFHGGDYGPPLNWGDCHAEWAW